VEADDQMRRLEFGVWWMSRQAIAAVLARTDLASGERLVALSLDTGPWWDGEINVELFETVLAYSPARGPERLLLATMAALADEEGAVRDLSTEQLCAAAAVADRTYRRARAALLASGQVEPVSGLGGRGNTNVWSVGDPRASCQALPPRLPRRVAPPAGARPLVATSSDHAATVLEASTAPGEKGRRDRTLPQRNRPILTGVPMPKGGHDRTVPDQNCPVLTGRGDGHPAPAPRGLHINQQEVS
jgi:hypothetical protein